MRSDSDSPGSSESDNPRESAVAAVQKRAAASCPSERSSHNDDVARKVQGLRPASAGIDACRIRDGWPLFEDPPPFSRVSRVRRGAARAAVGTPEDG